MTRKLAARLRVVARKALSVVSIRPGRGSARDERRFPLAGFDTNRVATPHVDNLSDEDLTTLNRMLEWRCFTVDAKGRRFGRRAWEGKREVPQAVPDPRIAQMNDRFGLEGKAVLEVGCFEGVHTVGLALLGAHVVAVDSRIENVVKSSVRAQFFGQPATIFKCDLEQAADWLLLPQVDLLHHVGVLYHLKDPVTHLLKLGALVRDGIMLDTHFSAPEDARDSYVVDGRSVPYMRFREGGRADAFSGMYDHAKWLTLDTIRELLGEAGFGSVEIVEERPERNGSRVLLFAARG
jgi:2-polyprenyl-3-methyl-5-hydroxy-6-metoxy-1,4-benzoquinol methylase